MHHLLVRHIAVGEDDFVDVFPLDQVLDLGLGQDGDAIRVERTGQLGRIAAPGDVGDLRRGEGHHLAGRIAPEHPVEVVEVPTGSAQDHHPPARHPMEPLDSSTNPPLGPTP
jgi:hypothetical protein